MYENGWKSKRGEAKEKREYVTKNNLFKFFHESEICKIKSQTKILSSTGDHGYSIICIQIHASTNLNADQWVCSLIEYEMRSSDHRLLFPLRVRAKKGEGS
jgi:hypothetical protein